jgi:hypothetical protein
MVEANFVKSLSYKLQKLIIRKNYALREKFKIASAESSFLIQARYDKLSVS